MHNHRFPTAGSALWHLSSELKLEAHITFIPQKIFLDHASVRIVPHGMSTWITAPSAWIELSPEQVTHIEICHTIFSEVISDVSESHVTIILHHEIGPLRNVPFVTRRLVFSLAGRYFCLLTLLQPSLFWLLPLCSHLHFKVLTLKYLLGVWSPVVGFSWFFPFLFFFVCSCLEYSLLVKLHRMGY